MKLIVGLGNPGRKYEGTRHNVGFELLSRLANRSGGGKAKSQFQGEVVEAFVAGKRALLLRPLTYMNLSGQSVRAAKDFYKLDLADVLVACDDFQLPLGKLRMRAKGSSGGQKGLQNIIDQLGTVDVARLRIGIGSPPPEWDVADFVLSKFDKGERADVDESLALAEKAVEDWVREGVDACMNRYN